MGIGFIAIYCVLVLLVLETAATLLITTGLDKRIARFQALSMLTATGFTTKESELILRHPIRRKIAMFLILFGVFSLAVIISTLSSILAQSFKIPQLLLLTVLLGVVLLFLKSKWITRKLKSRLHQHLEDDFALHELPLQEILYIDEDDLITEVCLHRGSAYIGRKAGEIAGKQEDLAILFIQRGLSKLRKGSRDLTLHEGDLLMVYGSRECIAGKFSQELEKMKEEIEHEEQITAMK
ncbi:MULTISPECIES: hypothetical protein [Paenibacillus]|uniref:hypothetical protein n=1 Tax=Paenibacillus TaxID=44249 RepID=UPI0022B895B4|nr:hypothetical protein [Paenibacillus caseinilyticus]MCZ8524023.1 hypothetical protein [Paenibacillus caseinilyticus]